MTDEPPPAWPAPLLSVIVPSFNQGRFIRETLDSILAQDYRPIEVLVFDGASTDGTVEVLRSFDGTGEVHWVSEPDQGVVDAVNKGLRAARGEILAIQSSDDLYLPGAFRAAVDAMRAPGRPALVFGDVQYIDEDSRLLDRTRLPAFSLEGYLGKSLYVPQPSTFFRASIARGVGLWEPGVAYAADADYWLRIALRHPVVKIDALLASYRYHRHQRDKESTRPARDWEEAVARLIRSGEIRRDLRPAARKGICLTWHHYTPSASWVRRTWHLYRAAVAQPRAVLEPGFPRRELLPGRAPIWAFLSRCKRAIRALAGDRPR